jgi:hypothetical protein
MRSIAGFYLPPIGPDPLFPKGTTEGSAFQSGTFTYSQGSFIQFSYNFITGELIPDYCNDWFGVALVNPLYGNILYFQEIGDVKNTTWSSINNGKGVVGPYGDFFLGQTTSSSYTFNLPGTYVGQEVQFGIGVFDLGDYEVPSALLVDNIKLNGNFMEGGNFETDPFGIGGFFNSNGGPSGLFEWLPSGSLSGVVEPGAGHFAYISTYNSQMVPAPAPLILLGSGLIGLIGLKRRIMALLG